MLCLRNTDACHILLARPWKFDKETNEGKIPLQFLRMTILYIADIKEKVDSKSPSTTCLASNKVMEESHRVDAALGVFLKKYWAVCEAPIVVEDFKGYKVVDFP